VCELFTAARQVAGQADGAGLSGSLQCFCVTACIWDTASQRLLRGGSKSLTGGAVRLKF